MIIIFIFPFLIAGLSIVWVFGIKPSLEDHISNQKTIKEFYNDRD